MKKITFILLLALLPTYNTFADQSQATHKLDIGIGGGITAFIFTGISPTVNMSLGVQSQWDISWLAMMNKFNATYAVGQSIAGQLVSYTIGPRFFLGTPYIFLDLYAGMMFFLFRPIIGFPMVTGITLGSNIPLSKTVNLQLSVTAEAKMIVLDLNAKLGIQFTL